MANLSYGGGNCSIDGNLRAIFIKYRKAILIFDKTSDNYAIIPKGKSILIFPYGQVRPLDHLFDYFGELIVSYAKGINIDGTEEIINIKPQMHFPELISTNTEDLTALSEEMNIGKLYKHRVDKTEIDKKIIEIIIIKIAIIIKVEDITNIFH